MTTTTREQLTTPDGHVLAGRAGDVNGRTLNVGESDDGTQVWIDVMPVEASSMPTRPRVTLWLDADGVDHLVTALAATVVGRQAMRRRRG